MRVVYSLAGVNDITSLHLNMPDVHQLSVRSALAKIVADLRALRCRTCGETHAISGLECLSYTAHAYDDVIYIYNIGTTCNAPMR